MTYLDGRTVYYGFDEQLRLSELKDGEEVITYAYDEAGRLAEKQFPNGMHTAYKYDSKGQIQELIHMDGEGILDQYQYLYDVIGNKTGIVKQRRGLEKESGNYQYGYDSLGRLNEVAKNGQMLRYYQYDAFGNRIYKREGEDITNYQHNSLNQLIMEVTVGEHNTEKTYEYDRRGNLSQVIENGNIRNLYLYSVLNRLEQATNDKGEIAKYQYNGLGHRVGKEEGRTKIQNIAACLDPVTSLREQTLAPDKKIQYTVDLTRDYNNLLQKDENQHRQTYLWDGNVAGVCEEGRNNICYYLQDELGSPMRSFDGDGKQLEYYGYDEFGKKLYHNNIARQPFGYTGYQEDVISKTYFAQAREYFPHQGQFLGRDQIAGFIELPLTLNQYSYCFNNPINLIDLNGKWPKQIESIGDKPGSAAEWIGDEVSDVGHFLYDNAIGKIVGTEQVLYETEYGGGSYEVRSHTGGDLIIIKKDQKGNFNGWSLNADFSFGGVIGNKQSISGKGWNPESWKYTNDLEVSGPGGISFASGLHVDKDGVGVQGASSGTTGNMPLKLPDGTQIDEFGSVSWSLTVENDIANWKQVLETVGVTAAIVGLIWVVANDATIIGILDDGLVAPLVAYLATKAPTIYQWFSQLSPEIIKTVNSCNT